MHVHACIRIFGSRAKLDYPVTRIIPNPNKQIGTALDDIFPMPPFSELYLFLLWSTYTLEEIGCVAYDTVGRGRFLPVDAVEPCFEETLGWCLCVAGGVWGARGHRRGTERVGL